MQTIRKVLQRKQAQYAQLAKEIDLLQQAEEKLREIAPLLAEADEEDEGTLLVEVDRAPDSGTILQEKAAAAATANQAADLPTDSKKPVALRWP